MAQSTITHFYEFLRILKIVKIREFLRVLKPQVTNSRTMVHGVL